MLHFFLSSLKQRSQHYEFILKVPSSYIKRTELSLKGDRSCSWDFVPSDAGLSTLKPLVFFCFLELPSGAQKCTFGKQGIYIWVPLCSSWIVMQCCRSCPLQLLGQLLWCGNNEYSCAVCFSSIKMEVQQTAWATPEMEVNLMYMRFLNCLSMNSTLCLCLVPGSLVQGVSVWASIDFCGPE